MTQREFLIKWNCDNCRLIKMDGSDGSCQCYSYIKKLKGEINLTKQDILEIIEKAKELKNLNGLTININIEDINIENN